MKVDSRSRLHNSVGNVPGKSSPNYTTVADAHCLVLWIHCSFQKGALATTTSDPDARLGPHFEDRWHFLDQQLFLLNAVMTSLMEMGNIGSLQSRKNTLQFTAIRAFRVLEKSFSLCSL